jgi:hypothetical protein
VRRELITVAIATALTIAAIAGMLVGDAEPVSRRAELTEATTADPDVGASRSDETVATDAPLGTTTAGPRATTDAVVPPTNQRTTHAAPPIHTGPAKGTPVRVGVHLGDNRSAAAQFGVGGLPDISPEEVGSVIAQVNANGGLAGRPIQPVFHRTDPVNGSFDAQGQRACEALIDDGNVEIVVDNALTPSKVLMQCASKKGVPLVWELHMVQITNDEAARMRDLLYRPSMPNSDRLGFIVDGLANAGFFKGAKVGIIRYDQPESKLISEKVFRPALARRKIPVVDEYKVAVPAAASGAANASGEASNAVLQFRQSGVTHVLFVPSGGALPLVFLPAAASQGWYPPYGLSTQDAPEFLALNFPEQQLRTSMVVGWVPDLDGAELPRNASFARCQSAMRSAGMTWDENIQPWCDGFYFLNQALSRSPGFSVATLRAGAEAIGTSFSSPYIFGTRFGRGRHDGPVQARLLKYDTSVRHFVYSGGPISFP